MSISHAFIQYIQVFFLIQNFKSLLGFTIFDHFLHSLLFIIFV